MPPKACDGLTEVNILIETVCYDTLAILVNYFQNSQFMMKSLLQLSVNINFSARKNNDWRTFLVMIIACDTNIIY